MKKLKFLFIVLFSLLINNFSLNAAEVKGDADVYKVIMHKVCLLYTSDAADE